MLKTTNTHFNILTPFLSLHSSEKLSITGDFKLNYLECFVLLRVVVVVMRSSCCMHVVLVVIILCSFHPRQ